MCVVSALTGIVPAAIDSDEAIRLAAAGALAALLNRWARHRSVGAKHATVARQGLERLFAALTPVKEPAGICRHLLDSFMAAHRTGQGRCQDGFKLHAT